MPLKQDIPHPFPAVYVNTYKNILGIHFVIMHICVDRTFDILGPQGPPGESGFRGVEVSEQPKGYSNLLLKQWSINKHIVTK